MRKLSLGISPCPNDTFIFEGLIHQKFNDEFKFNPVLLDVEQLNQMAFKRQLDITKVSAHAGFYLLGDYKILSSGGAMGRNCGPLLLSKTTKMPKSGKIALPGEYTTASLLFKLAVPGDFEPVYMPFNQIIDAICQDKVTAGVIIHESRFTYSSHHLVSLLDLGQWWENQTGCLIPLGIILIDGQLDRSVHNKIEELIRQSILYAEQNKALVWDYIKMNAQELDDAVIQSHIDLYVNEYSKQLGQEGKDALFNLYEMCVSRGILPGNGKLTQDAVFVN
ncbi:MAG: 1,4-dihydroxy-6-naphthoate synthase [Deltaproteobacteria bacterium]|nr:1,4-dihydroxy-6-naphthoate synthase [Deltaproteobacteria bacterium]